MVGGLVADVFAHISGHPSAAGRVQDRVSLPAKVRRSTTVLCNHPVDRSMLLLPCCLQEHESMVDLSCRLRIARLIRFIVMVLQASHVILPAASWYATRVLWACSRAKKLQVFLLTYTA